ncbi:DM13 domain-containing protein [Pyruvatibacter sp. HU-CL02332]|uniref:DM13 domain-containing protein n=1 Tax=Pyruvatibacter sp. HU-CL02332 TaxID=3127650 RepID=UPI002968B137|nr:DM13 domain-containing protein [Alphaproteobacteria bacterium]
MTFKTFFAAAAIAVSSLFAVALPASADTHNAARAFDVAEKPLDGSWSIETRDDGAYIVLSDDFRTSNAPDLKIFLSQQDVNDVRDNTATNNAVLVSKLDSTSGAQEYKLPADFSTDAYTSVLIHCEQFSVFWGGANL